MKSNEEAVRAHLREAGYGDSAIMRGLAFARSEGVTHPDDIAERALARILYTDAQLERGEMFPWEDGEINWDAYREEA